MALMFKGLGHFGGGEVTIHQNYEHEHYWNPKM